MVTILLIIVAIILVIGIIRVIITPSDGFWDFVMDICFLDLLWDLIVIVIEAIFDTDW